MCLIHRATAFSIVLFYSLTLLNAAENSTPIMAVVPDFNHLQKWNDMHGDTADPFWADDDNLYHFTCDGRGFGKQKRNFCFNKLTGADQLHLKGELINAMDDYGNAGKTEADRATWKVTGQECIDGVFYAFVVRNIYGDKSLDPLMRQTSFNTSLIKSTDRGLTWTRPAKENYNQPMWPGTRFGGPCFIHYGKNGGAVTRDGADKFVYTLSNNGFWNGGDDYILGRVRRADLPKLNAADWMYFIGGDGLSDSSWTKDLAKAKPILAQVRLDRAGVHSGPEPLSDHDLVHHAHVEEMVRAATDDIRILRISASVGAVEVCVEVRRQLSPERPAHLRAKSLC